MTTIDIAERMDAARALFENRRIAPAVLAVGLAALVAGLFISTDLLIVGAVLTLLAAVRLHYIGALDRSRRTYMYLRCRCPVDGAVTVAGVELSPTDARALALVIAESGTRCATLPDVQDARVALERAADRIEASS
jgi:hypothetical protein